MNSEVEVRLLQNVLSNIATAILLFDNRYTLVYINTAGEMIFEGSARQLIGSSVAEIFRGCQTGIEEDLNRCIETGVSISERNIVVQLIERTVTVNFYAVPLYDGTVPTHILVELSQVDLHLRISREEQLLSQQHATNMLLRGLAHEIKNPLGGLRGAAQLLDGELDSDGLKEYTKIIIEEADRLQDLMNRIAGPKNLPNKRRINIHKVVERVRQLVQAEVTDQIEIKQDYDPSIPDVNVDSHQILQAILNVVRNAVQAIETNGHIILRTRIDRRVPFGRNQSKLVVRLDVTDNGVGIKPEFLSQIFYPMVTSRAEGTGLGLSIAQSLINMHGGLIECSSTPGQTVFSIYLPLENGND